MRPDPLPWMLSVLLLVAWHAGARASEPAPSDATALSLESAAEGRVLRLAGVDGETLLVSDGLSAPVPAPRAAPWTLRGDIRTHAGLLDWWPEYHIERDPRHEDGRQRARVSVLRRVDIAPGEKELSDATLKEWRADIPRTTDPFASVWSGDPSQPGAVVAVWVLRGRVVQTQVAPVPQVGSTLEFKVSFTFSLTSEEAHGKPALLLWRNGAVVAPLRSSESTPSNDAFHAVAFDDPAALTAALERGKRRPKISVEDRLELADFAAESGALACLSVLLDDPIRVAASKNSGTTLLDLAARAGRTKAVAMILQTEARASTTSAQAADALDHAVDGGHTDIVRLLIPHAQQARDWKGLTTRTWASVWSAGYPDLIDLLEPLLLDAERQKTPRLPASKAEAELVDHAAEGHLPMVKYLLGTMSTDPNGLRDGTTALLAAAAYGETGIARLLLQAGADPNKADARKLTPLMTASGRNDPELAQLLLAAGAQVNAADASGMTALHYAAAADASAIVAMLLDAGADIEICSIRDATPLDLAIMGGAIGSVAPLLDRGACIGLGAAYSTELLLAAISHDLDRPLGIALEQGWSATSTFAGIWPALRVAEVLGSERCAARLRAAGATADPKRPLPLVAPEDLDAPLHREIHPVAVDPRPTDMSAPAAVVRLRAIVDGQGRVLFPVVVDTPDRTLVPAAIRAAQASRYAPPRARGAPAATVATVDISFPASRDRVFSDTDLTQPPRVISDPRPYAPRSVARLKAPSKVVASYVINVFGRIEQVRIEESPSQDCTHAVLLALSQWRYSPGRIRGTPVAVRHTQKFLFDPKS